MIANPLAGYVRSSRSERLSTWCWTDRHPLIIIVAPLQGGSPKQLAIGANFRLANGSRDSVGTCPR